MVGKYMRIILSRKGFDSANGRVPSPIFPDGRILSLPIPDKKSPIKYSDIDMTWNEYNLGAIVKDLTKETKERIRPSSKTHFDPDLRRQSLGRADGWRPLFGQTGAAQGHLRNNGVQVGDIFLFFGLFQEVALKAKTIVRKKSTMARHVLWGWLQIGQIIDLEKCVPKEFDWTKYHPHRHGPPARNNTLYVANERLCFPSLTVNNKAGAGVFPLFRPELQLTASDAKNRSEWELPKWMYPRDGKQPLSFHGDLNRWRMTGSTTRLNAVPIGQEFVLDCEYYPEALNCLNSLLTSQ
jgi:hypothetical protein